MRCADLSELAGEPIGATAIRRRALAPDRGRGNMAARRLRGRRVCPRLPVEPRRSGSSGAVLAPVSSFAVRGVLAVALSSRSSSTRASTRARCGVSSSSTPDELADVDLETAGETRAAPLVLVCGHGTRDACCALRGTAVYGELAEHLGDGRALDLVAPGRPPLCGQRPRAARPVSSSGASPPRRSPASSRERWPGGSTSRTTAVVSRTRRPSRRPR